MWELQIQGKEECFSKFGWGTRNREGQELVARNGMAIAGSFFEKWEIHKITYSSGHHRTELDLVVVRKRQLWRVNFCKAMAEEHVTTQHKPVVFVVWMEKWRDIKSRSWKMIKRVKSRGNILIENKERLRARYEQLSEEMEGSE